MASVPPGTGVMILANDQVEVFDNTIEKNQTAGLSIVSYLITGEAIKDEKYDPYCEAIHIHDNHFAGNGGKPTGALGEMLGKVLGHAAAGHSLRRHRRPQETGRRQAARRRWAFASATTARPDSSTSSDGLSAGRPSYRQGAEYRPRLEGIRRRRCRRWSPSSIEGVK